jgi:enoyl-CoA hydratase
MGDKTMDKVVTFQKEDGIGIIKINRPDALNSLNEQVLIELEEALAMVQGDDEILTFIITGEGKAFVAGADIEYMSKMQQEEGTKWGSFGADIFRKLESMDKPSIAAVNGFALGGGCELAMACDMRIASERAKFGQPEVGLGIAPGFSGTLRLPRIVGKAKAIELILTCDIINAQEAKEIGLVNKVVPAEELMNEAKALARKINKNAPLAVRNSNAAIKRGLEADMDAGIRIENELFGQCFATNDQKEGMAAFLEKRKPVYKGK